MLQIAENMKKIWNEIFLIIDSFPPLVSFCSNLTTVDSKQNQTDGRLAKISDYITKKSLLDLPFLYIYKQTLVTRWGIWLFSRLTSSGRGVPMYRVVAVVTDWLPWLLGGGWAMFFLRLIGELSIFFIRSML